ncbi:hypothetical protein TWF192_005721 [Orbilia oligospora]|uniref:ATP phosphoribosyltransferase n=1 Tax=Orbilia oligospora TaxID=2813651 RepID=A0A6G1MLX4_ORBOL|nr:hypothetical protein TWF191_003918 [Orbilia oligospora]KAF3263440.1 hypothetical protein TWF192_005721 [Orbilia oligospora]
MTTKNCHGRWILAFYTPRSCLEACKAAVFAAGAGRYPGPGNYTECCWTTFGTGQYRPGNTANPHIGAVGELEQVEEAKVEVLCIGQEVLETAIQGLKEAHEYEEPAYHILKIDDVL